MAEYEVSGFPESVTISFKCLNCDTKIEEDVSIPLMDLDSEKETFSATRNDDYFDLECPKCGKIYNCQTTGSCCGSFIFMDGIPDDYDISFVENYNDDI